MLRALIKLAAVPVAALLVFFAFTGELHNSHAGSVISVIGCVGVIIAAAGIIFVTFVYDKLPPSKRRFDPFVRLS
jgi:hypothetical protein